MSYLDRRIVVSFVMLCVGCAGGPGPGPSGSEPGSVPGGSGGARPAGAGGARGEAGSGGAAGGGAAGSGGAAGGGAAGSGGQAGKPAIDAAAPADAGPSGAVPPPPIAEEPLPPCKRTVPVAGGGALGGAIAAAMPGDCLVAADGDYPAQNIGAKGNADAPIVVRAANRGKAVFTGRVQLDGATYVVIEGFDYTGGSGVTVTNANHNRITRSHFRLGSGTWISLTGTSDSNRIDHNDLGPLDGGGHFIHPTGMSERTRIDHNHLHDLANCGGNGCESISLGCCGAATDAHETFNVVEYNLLVNCDGEGEMIGMKSSSNTVRFNTIRTSRGHISFRAGKKNTAHSNYILGGGKAGTNGIRMLDEDHLVYNNYVDVSGFPLRMQNGDIPGFPPIKRARVVNNTFVVNGGAIELGGTSHSIAPADSTFANNLIVGSTTLINARGADGITLQGNIAFPMGGALGLDRPADQIRVVDPQLTKVGEILRPGTTGPTVDAARPGFPFVTQDIDGRPRTTADVGAHAAGTPGHGPLTPADVGPEAP